MDESPEEKNKFSEIYKIRECIFLQMQSQILQRQTKLKIKQN